jgi:hypothetical protein
MNYTRVVLALTALTACSSTGPSRAKPRVYTVEVRPATTDCMSWFGPHPCFQVRELPEGVLQPRLMSIEGFTYRWGQQYQLEIAEHIVTDPPADGPDRRYVLRRVIEDQVIPAGTEFTYLAWSGSPSIARTGAGDLRILLDYTIPCGEDCEAIGAAIEGRHRFELHMRFTGNTEAPLTLSDWSSCPATIMPTRCDE